jgi:hypothetical protein
MNVNVRDRAVSSARDLNECWDQLLECHIEGEYLVCVFMPTNLTAVTAPNSEEGWHRKQMKHLRTEQFRKLKAATQKEQYYFIDEQMLMINISVSFVHTDD